MNHVEIEQADRMISLCEIEQRFQSRYDQALAAGKIAVAVRLGKLLTKLDQFAYRMAVKSIAATA